MGNQRICDNNSKIGMAQMGMGSPYRTRADAVLQLMISYGSWMRSSPEF